MYSCRSGVDTNLIELLAKSLTPSNVEALSRALPPQVLAPLMGRVEQVLKEDQLKQQAHGALAGKRILKTMQQVTDYSPGIPHRLEGAASTDNLYAIAFEWYSKRIRGVDAKDRIHARRELRRRQLSSSAEQFPFI